MPKRLINPQPRKLLGQHSAIPLANQANLLTAERNMVFLERGSLSIKDLTWEGEVSATYSNLPFTSVEFRPDRPISGKLLSGNDEVLLETESYRLTGWCNAFHFVGAEWDYQQVDVAVREQKPGERRLMSRALGSIYNMHINGEDPLFFVHADGWQMYLGRTTLEFGSWTIVFDDQPRASEVRDTSKPFQLTHVVSIHRSGGRCFSSEDADKVLQFLFWLLTLCCGTRVGVYHALGFSTGQPRPVWAQLTEQNINENIWLNSWVPQSCRSSPLRIAEPLFLLWSDKKNQAWLRLVISYYADACRRRPGSEAGITLAHSGIELLGYLQLVERKQVFDEEAFSRLTAPNKYRVLLDRAQIPYDLPVKLQPAVSKLGAIPGLTKFVADGPGLVTAVRNALVHPSPKNRLLLEALDGMDRYRIWELALHYFESLLLHAIGYRGMYRKRIIDPHNSLGRPVPWVEAKH